MRPELCVIRGLAFFAIGSLALAATPHPADCPVPLGDWQVELIDRSAHLGRNSSIVEASNGTVYLGQGPTASATSGDPSTGIVLALRNGKYLTFADGLGNVRGLEWCDGTLYVVHPPYLSSFRDADGDGRSDRRVDLVRGLGPTPPDFDGSHDHLAGGIRLGLDGFLYLAVGDKGIPRGIAADGTTIRLQGGGVVRIRPDGRGLEVVSSGQRDLHSLMLGHHDEIFTSGGSDPRGRWVAGLTHHIMGGDCGYPYRFLAAKDRTLPIMTGPPGGTGGGGVYYDEDGLPEEYRGNLFVCDPGLQAVFRFEIRKAGGTFALTRRTALVTRGELEDFRPATLALSRSGDGFWVLDPARDESLRLEGRLFRLRWGGAERRARIPVRGGPMDVAGLDHSALSVRMAEQTRLAAQGEASLSALVGLLCDGRKDRPRIHALWAIDAIGGEVAREAIRRALADLSPIVRLEATRSCGIRRDRPARDALIGLLNDRDPAVRREAAIALGRIRDRAALPALIGKLGEPDRFAAWSVRRAIRDIGIDDPAAIVDALLDSTKRAGALLLTEEAWDVPSVEALTTALGRVAEPAVRGRIIVNLAGQVRGYPEWSGLWYGPDPLAGPFPRKTRAWDERGMKAVSRGLKEGLGDSNAAVRFEAILGLGEAGSEAAAPLAAAVATESDPRNLEALASVLGKLGDRGSIRTLSTLLLDHGRPVGVRTAALEALVRSRSPESLRACLSVVYDSKSPESMVATALASLARAGIIPANDVASFLENPSPQVRAAAVLSLDARRPLPEEIRTQVLALFEDGSTDVRQAAILAAAPLRLREALPRLIDLASSREQALRPEALFVLCRMPDPRAIPIYFDALRESDPALRRAATRALVSLGEHGRLRLEEASRASPFTGEAALSVRRILARFDPLTSWMVIGPFPRRAPQPFKGDAPINATGSLPGLSGRKMTWSPRSGDAATGRLSLDHLEPRDASSGTGFEPGVSPELCAYAATSLESDADREALLLVGSSGRGSLTLNGRDTVAFGAGETAGRGYSPDSEVVPVRLRRGTNRLVVSTRQGAGHWSFSVQVSRPDPGDLAARVKDPQARPASRP